jgi:hypothetical protein
MLPRINPTNTQAWFLLKKHHEEEMSRRQMRDLFAADPERFQKFSIVFEEMLFDYSKNIINQKTVVTVRKVKSVGAVNRENYLHRVKNALDINFLIE